MNTIEQIFSLLIKGIEIFFQFLFELIEALFSGIPKKKEGYHAEFAPSWTILSSREHGFNLTGRSSLSTKNSYQNSLIVGGTGTGKSSVVLLPTLYSMYASTITHDPNGELAAKSSGFKQQHQSADVKILNFAKPEISCGYNPLARANTSSEIQKVSSMLVGNAMGERSKDPFWNTQAVALIAMLITILKKQGEPEYVNLFNVRQLLNQLGGNPKAVDALFAKYADDILFSEYKSFLTYDSKVVSGIIASCKAALQLFADESVAKVTSTDNIDFMDFRNRRVALYIQNSVADQKYYSVLTSIFFEQFFSFALGRFPTEEEQDIFLLIDEASSLNLPTLPMAMANVRKHRCGIMLLVQDFKQLVHHYGTYDGEAIKSNCFAKMYFTGQSLETTKELEQILGKFEYRDEEQNDKKVVRSLMTSDEIRTMEANRALLICGHHAPVYAKLRPYYKSVKYRNYSQLPPPVNENVLPQNEIPVLNLKAHA